MARENSSIVDAMETQGRVPGFEWQRDWEAQQSSPKMGTDEERARSHLEEQAARHKGVSLGNYRSLKASTFMSLIARS